MMKRNTAATWCAWGSVCCFAGVFAIGACGPAAVTPATAESGYLAQSLACVDKSATLVESRACRERVRAAWGVSADGGAE